MTAGELLYHERRTSGDEFDSQDTQVFFNQRLLYVLGKLSDEDYERISKEVGW